MQRNTPTTQLPVVPRVCQEFLQRYCPSNMYDMRHKRPTDGPMNTMDAYSQYSLGTCTRTSKKARTVAWRMIARRQVCEPCGTVLQLRECLRP